MSRHIVAFGILNWLSRSSFTGRLELFDTAKDPGERHDVAAQMTDKAKDLNQRLTVYLLEVQAQMPRANPNYDASKPTSSRKGGKEKGRE